MKTLLALIPLAWSTCMPSPYTPNPANNPATISLPNPGDPVASAVADQAWKDIADKDARKVEGAVAGQSGTIDGFVQVGSGGTIDVASGGTFTVESGATEIHNATETHTGATNLNGVTHVNGNSLVCNNGLDVTGGADIDALIVGTVSTFTGNDTHLGRLKFSGTGRPEHNVYFGVGTDADQDITVAGGYEHVQAVLTNTRRYRMRNAGCNGKETISITNETYATHDLNIYQDDNTTIIVDLSSTGGDFFGVELWNDGLGNAASSWHVKSASHKP